MRLPPGFDVGASTHTGLVRLSNEDDFLVAGAADGPPHGLLCALADGMGGVAGGAEASRTALRGLGTGLLTAGKSPAAVRLRAAFLAAGRRVEEQAQLMPSLRDMGTTLTALWFTGAQVTVGHVGDSRAYRWRRGRLEQVTQDHAVRSPDNYLTRCIGGGGMDSEPDLRESATEAGDRWLLVSDGVWSAVAEAELQAILAANAPQAAAEALVQAALAAGGTDNATAVVVHVLPSGGTARVVDLPRDELARGLPSDVQCGSLRPPLWPALLLLLAVPLLLLAVLRWFYGIDVREWVGRGLGLR